VRNPLAGSVAIVQDQALEVEADRLGHRAAAQAVAPRTAARLPSPAVRPAPNPGRQPRSVQRMESSSTTTSSSKPSGGYQAPALYARYATWLTENVLPSVDAREEVRRRLVLAQAAIGYPRAKLPFGAPTLKHKLKTPSGGVTIWRRRSTLRRAGFSTSWGIRS
jgi:hypothetical protein